MARRFGTQFSKHASGISADYAVEHAASLYLLDASGHSAGAIPHGTPPAGIARALRDALAGRAMASEGLTCAERCAH